MDSSPMDPGPRLSVVVVVLGGRRYIPRCLEALMRQTGVQDLEILVPCDDRITDAPVLQQQFPSVKFPRAARYRTYAELRALGVRESRGAIVALTEDHCAPDPDWCVRILEAHGGPHAAVGGAVEKDADTTLNWAVYLCDFSRYMNPLREGPSRYLTDCNVSYKRRALDSVAHLWAAEFHETSVNWALHARGESLWLSGRIIVRQQRSLRLGAALRERFAFGRLFASTRVSTTSRLRGVIYAGLCCTLPAILVGRVARDVLRKRRHGRELLRALPAILLLTTVWAGGELVGYLTGRAAGGAPAPPSTLNAWSDQEATA
jgi:hypothetical protein